MRFIQYLLIDRSAKTEFLLSKLRFDTPINKKTPLYQDRVGFEINLIAGDFLDYPPPASKVSKLAPPVDVRRRGIST
jgi:hypothetical protein